MKIAQYKHGSVEDGNSAYFRRGVIGQMLADQGVELDVIEPSALTTSEFVARASKSDLVFVERLLSTREAYIYVHLRATGTGIVVDIDDFYPQIPGVSRAHDYWIKGIVSGEKIIPGIEQFEMCLPAATAITTPSYFLAEYFQDRHPRVKLVNNYYDPELFLDKDPIVLSEKRVIGWGGSAGHIVSWYDSQILKALKKFLVNKKDDVAIAICGSKNIFDYVKKYLGNGVDVLFAPFTSIDMWARMVKGFGVYVCPLNTGYDRARSPLKMMEAGLARIPLIMDGNSWTEMPYPVSFGVIPNETRRMPSLNAWIEYLETWYLEEWPDSILDDAHKWALSRSPRLEENQKTVFQIYEGLL